MPNYTPEQIEQATPGLKPCPFCGKQPQRYATIRDDGSEYNIQYYCNHGQESAMNIVETGYFGLEEHAFNCWNTRNSDALEAVQKERERLENDLADALDCKKGDGPTAFNMLIARAERAEAYAAKLEKAGDDMRESSDGSILHCDAIRDWDAARKEKPGA